MELKGIVIFKLANKGSFSENINPYLYKGQGEFVKIYKEGDNPFENSTLEKFDGKNVIINGEYDEYQTFVINQIDLLKDEHEIVLCENENKVIENLDDKISMEKK